MSAVDDFSELVTRHHRAVWAICLGVIGDPARADEATQEVFVTAWRRRDGLRDPERAGAWLRQIARNQALDLRRADERRRRREAHQAVAPLPDPVEWTQARERAEVLRAALDELDPEAREALVLFHTEERSSREVAAQLGLSDAAVRQRLRRARQSLRGAVEARLQATVDGRPGAALVAAVLAALGTAQSAEAAATSRWRRWTVTGGAAVALGVIASLVALPPTPGAEVAAAPQTEPAAPLRVAAAPLVPASLPVLAEADEGWPEPTSPAEEALFAVASAAGWGAVRCDLEGIDPLDLPLPGAAWDADGEPVAYPAAQRLEMFAFALPGVERTVLHGTVVTGILPPGPADEHGLLSMNPDVEPGRVRFGPVRAGTLSSCGLDWTPVALERNPPVGDAPWEAVLALADDEIEVEAEVFGRGLEPIQVALDDPGLSPEARAVVRSWVVERGDGLDAELGTVWSDLPWVAEGPLLHFLDHAPATCDEPELHETL